MCASNYSPLWRAFAHLAYNCLKKVHAVSHSAGACPRARAWVLAVPCLCLAESVEEPARSGIGPERSDMGLRPPRSVQMASKCGGIQPLPCPRAFTMALIGGAMEPGSSHT